MKFTAVIVTISLALSSTGAFAHTVRHRSSVNARMSHRRAAAPAPLRGGYNNPSRGFSAYDNPDVWGQRGGYYGPMITTGAGGR